MFSFHTLRVVRHSFVWGGETFQDYMIDISSNGVGIFYNFKNVKQGEKRQHSEWYNCKFGIPETVFLGEEDLKSFKRSIDNLNSFY